MRQSLRLGKAVLCLAATFAAFSLLAGCPGQTNYYPEFFYGDTGVLVNLVSNLTFGADWALDPALEALESAAGWYLGFEGASDAGVAPPEVAEYPRVSKEVYRLECKSVLPYGDFTGTDEVPVETGAVTLGDLSAGWVFSPSVDLGGDGTQEIVGSTDAYAITGNTLYYETNLNTSRLDFAIRDSTYGAVDGFLQGASYLVRFSYRSDEGKPIVFEFRDDTHPEVTWLFYSGTDGGSEGSSLVNTMEFPPAGILRPAATSAITSYCVIEPGDEADYYFTLGSLIYSSSDVQNAYIDNFRMVRTDLAPRIRLALVRALSLPVVGNEESSYTLESGRYRFSVYIHDDPTVGTVANRYQCNALTITMEAGGLTYTTIAKRGTDPWLDDGNWSRITVETPAGDSHDTRTDDPSSAAMVVTVAPTDYSGELTNDAGSIFISAPVLQFVTAEE